MTQQEIEGNRIIAEFMGWTIEHGMEKEENPYYNAPYKPGWIPAMFLLSDLKYHTSWDWLMPVVEKIRDVTGMKTIENTIKYLISRLSPTRQTLEFNSIKDLWTAVVYYLKWYNTQKQ